VGRGFVLLGWGHDPARSLSAPGAALLRSIGGRAIGIAAAGSEAAGLPLIDVDGEYRRWFESLGSSTVLIRPDFYLFGRGEPEALVNALAQHDLWTTTRPDALHAAS
jgi:hypothetical protein